MLRRTVAARNCLNSSRSCRLPDRDGGVFWGARVGAAFVKLGHTVRLMAPKFVAPYRKSGKNDDNDAAAICEAVAARACASCR